LKIKDELYNIIESKLKIGANKKINH